jgi:hypothetical protein
MAELNTSNNFPERPRRPEAPIVLPNETKGQSKSPPPATFPALPAAMDSGDLNLGNESFPHLDRAAYSTDISHDSGPNPEPSSPKMGLVKKAWSFLPANLRDPAFLSIVGLASVGVAMFPSTAACTLAPKIYIGAQVLSILGLFAGLSGLAAENMRTKLTRTSLGAGLFAAQFAVMGVAGVGIAWGGALSMGIACVRSLVFRMLQNSTQRTRNLVAGGFVAAGWTFMVSGFGLVSPLVPLQALLSGEHAALATCLPMVASACGAIGNAMPRMRYVRPIMGLGALINCTYNALFSGSIGHLISEGANIAVHVRQFLGSDLPPKWKKGIKMPLLTRIRGYLRYMSDSKLPEDYMKT